MEGRECEHERQPRTVPERAGREGQRGLRDRRDGAFHADDHAARARAESERGLDDGEQGIVLDTVAGAVIARQAGQQRRVAERRHELQRPQPLAPQARVNPLAAAKAAARELDDERVELEAAPGELEPRVTGGQERTVGQAYRGIAGDRLLEPLGDRARRRRVTHDGGVCSAPAHRDAIVRWR